MSFPAALTRRAGVCLCVGAAWGATATAVWADSWAVGPRLSFVRADVTPGSDVLRQTGGLLRARTSPRTALELSVDYRSEINESLTERIRSLPVQGSLLVYPVRATLSPYLLGGIGWYSQRRDLLERETVLETSTTRRVGYHAGVGGELMLGRRAAVHLDYRYTLIGIGEGTGTTAPGALPLPGTLWLQERLKLSHEGSMWSTGLSVLF